MSSLSAPRIPKLVDPPRDIPAGLRLKILTPYDVTGTLLYTVPAAALMLVATFGNPPRGARIALVVVASLLLLLALQSALPALVRAMDTLRRMRHGFLTVGRIVSCYLSWDKKSSETPYAEFLENWTVRVARSQMGKAVGCLLTLFKWVFVAPLILLTIGFAVVGSVRWLQASGAPVIVGDLTMADGVKFVLMAIALLICLAVFMRLFRRSMVDQVEPYMEWRKLTAPGPDGVYDEHARLLVAEAKRRGQQISLKESLPEESSSPVYLICKVEYSVMDKFHVAAARARLTRRLDPTGVELLIFDPANRRTVDLLVGLPEDVQIDSEGQWKDVHGAGVLAAVTGTFIAVAMIALAVNLRVLAG